MKIHYFSWLLVYDSKFQSNTLHFFSQQTVTGIFYSTLFWCLLLNYSLEGSELRRIQINIWTTRLVFPEILFVKNSQKFNNLANDLYYNLLGLTLLFIVRIISNNDFIIVKLMMVVGWHRNVFYWNIIIIIINMKLLSFIFAVKLLAQINIYTYFDFVFDFNIISVPSWI